MCGLTGVASTERLKNAKERRSAFFDAMFMNTLRGDHSTGIAAVGIGEETKEPVVFKKALNGPDFLSLDKTRRIISDIEKFSMMIGHNRASTSGAPINMNAHPFVAGHITLTHNGHVSNAFSLLPQGKTCHIQVDSAQVASAMELLGEKEVLERCTGAFAFVWHNAEDGTLNFARNSGRPLKFCYVKDENTMWWMSERTMLVSILDRNDVKIEGPFYNVPENLWYKFKVGNLREYHTIPFVPRLQSSTRSATVGGPPGPRMATPTSPGNSTRSTTPTTMGGGKDVFLHGSKVARATGVLINSLLASMVDKPAVEEIQRREFELKKGSCRPQGWKKVRRTTDKLSGYGFDYEQLVVVDLAGFKTYVNQKKLGGTTGRIFNTNVPIHISSLTLEQFMDYKQLTVLLGRVVNFKPDKTGHQAIIVEPHPLAEEFNAAWISRWKAVEAISSRRTLPQNPTIPPLRPQLQLPSPRQVSIPIVSEERLATFLDTGTPQPRGDVDVDDGVDSGPWFSHCGPNQTAISAERYRELTKIGCAICSGDIDDSITNSKKIFWIDNSPVCPMCNTDPDTMQNYGPTVKGVMH